MTRTLASKLVDGEPAAIARCLTLIENGGRNAKSILEAVGPRTGKAHVVGITGAPGTGKSTLISRATAELRGRGKTVGILTVDPSGPFSEGALLGDRLRMREHFLDAGVFIRSLATRGGHGGLASSIGDAIRVLEASGKDVVLIETIGVGQDQIGVAAIADTIVITVAPMSGDEIQAMKAGLFEIADIFVVNKADLRGADEAVAQLSELFADDGIPILKTSAVNQQGIGPLIDAIEWHRATRATGKDRDRKRLRRFRLELRDRLRDRLLERVVERVGATALEHWAKQIAERRLGADAATEAILRKVGL